ncbi:Nn.00g009790.m01.CDS01 [Neocucurbitaria sp. VM-36]
MVQDVFSLHKLAGGDNVTFPFFVKDYQRYVFGDDRLAHRFGTDLAKAFIAHGPGFGATQPAQSTTTTSNQRPTNDVAVAVLSDYVPTATHSLRNHFTAYLNRHLISINARPALKIDIHGVEGGLHVRHGPQAYHVDRERLGARTIIVLADIRMSEDREAQINTSLRNLGIDSFIVFAYLISIDGPSSSATLSPILSFVVSPSIKDVENMAQADRFTMNEGFVRFILGRDYVEFCQFLRRQDDFFARLLLDYAIGGRCNKDDLYEQNVKFLIWDVAARESM